MLFKQYRSVGLAHFSYMIADQGQATIIDPSRDIDGYLNDAKTAGFQIDQVLETHRNEDYVIGSCEVETATGAKIFHADSQWDYKYGQPAENGQEFWVGRLKLEALHTPGHTPGSMSYVLHDPDGNPWIIFSGDSLFSGDVGRVDLLGRDRLAEMASHMYDSLFNKIIPLGDGIIVCPAHGAGSVCGSEIAERTWTTVGLEKRLNPKLQVETLEEFIELHAKMLERPPYFQQMEVLNLSGAPIMGRLPQLKPLMPEAFEKSSCNSQVVDTRDQVSFAAAHVPGSTSIWEEILPGFAGWFLSYEKPVAFVCDPDDIEEITRMMVRMGFDNLDGYLNGGMVAWARAGKPLDSIDLLSAQAFCDLMKNEEYPFLLDLRGTDEIKGDGLKNGTNIHLTHLLENLESIPMDHKVIPLCTSGYRSMIAASLLKKAGWANLVVPVGGLGAWRALNCDFEL